MNVALIDADSIIHIVAYHNAVPSSMLELMVEEDPEAKEELIQQFYKEKDSKPVLDHVDSFITDIIHKTHSTHYLGFVGAREGSDTFRHKLAVTKPYKGQRGKSPHWTKYWKPIIIGHMVDKWKFIELFHIEADDACSICANKLGWDGIGYTVCSPDKDLRQIKGHHYDYKKLEEDFVTEEQSLYNLYRQVFIGDSVDNISGLPKVGPKSPLLEFPGCITEEDYRDYTRKAFESKGFGDMYEEQLALVYMLRELDYIDLKSYPKPIEFVGEGIVTENLNQIEDVGIPNVPPSFIQ